MDTVPKEIDFPRKNMKCNGENVILCGIFHVVSRFPPSFHVTVYRGYLDCFSNSVHFLPIVSLASGLLMVYYKNNLDLN